MNRDDPHWIGVNASVYGRDGRELGIVTDMKISVDGMPTIGVERRPEALFVAGSFGQGAFWAREMSYDKHAAAIWRGGDFQRPRHGDVFFVGTWERVPVEELRMLWDDIEFLGLHPTFVCAPDGEVIERQACWTKWTAESSGKETRWHVFDSDPLPRSYTAATLGIGNGEDGYRTCCGLPITRKQLVQSKAWAMLERYGAPRDGCAACAYAVAKWPITGALSSSDVDGRGRGEAAMAELAKQLEDGLKKVSREAAKAAESMRGYRDAASAAAEAAKFVMWEVWERGQF